MKLQPDHGILVDDLDGPLQMVVDGRVVTKARYKEAKKTSAISFVTRKSTARRGTVTHSIRGGIANKHGMMTRGMTTMAARNAVFNTRELLEGIFSHLSVRQLFAVERVCAHWRLVVTTSARLSREKFLAVDNKQGLLLHLDKSKSVIKAQQSGDLTRFGSVWLARQTTIHPATLNTLLFNLAPPAERQSLIDRCETCETLKFSLPAVASSNNTPKSYFNPAAAVWYVPSSAHAMFTCNPPSRSVEVEVAFTLASSKTGKPLRRRIARILEPERHKVERTDGVRWGDVLREVDIVLFVAAEKKATLERGARKADLVVDWERCKIWMRGVVFLDEGEREALEKGMCIGRKGVEDGSVG